MYSIISDTITTNNKRTFETCRAKFILYRPLLRITQYNSSHSVPYWRLGAFSDVPLTLLMVEPFYEFCAFFSFQSAEKEQSKGAFHHVLMILFRPSYYRVMLWLVEYRCLPALRPDDIAFATIAGVEYFHLQGAQCAWNTTGKMRIFRYRARTTLDVYNSEVVTNLLYAVVGNHNMFLARTMTFRSFLCKNNIETILVGSPLICSLFELNGAAASIPFEGHP